MQTQRLIIDSIKEEDKEDYFYNISNDKKVLETFICKYVEKIEDFDFSRYLGRNDIFAIRLKENNKLIGILSTFSKTDTSIEIGYGIGSKYWNNGYVTEAVKEFISYLFDNNIKTIYASFFKENIASKRVMEKCGMKYSHIVYNELEYLNKAL